MYTLWIFAAVLAAASGDVGLGYQYKVPHTSYGVPSYQFGESSGLHGSSLSSSSHGSSTGFNFKGQSSQSGYVGSTVSPTSSTGFTGQSTLSGAGPQVGHGQLSGSGVSGLYYPQTVVNTDTKGHYYYPSSVNIGYGSTNLARPVYSSFSGDNSHSLSPSYNEYQNQYLTTAAHKYQQYYVQQQPPQIFKHYFVHTAPEEPEVPKPRNPIVLPPAQKHYKIIFVKTPSETRAPQIIPVPQQHEEKTIVYVLSKKQEQPQDILVPKIEHKPPTKPEVYFVKYKTKEDSQAVIDDIVNDYNKGQGQTVTFSGLDSAQAGGFGSGSSGSFAGSGSHSAIGPYPIYSTGSLGGPSSFSQGHYTEQISHSPITIHSPVSDFVTESYDLNKVSTGSEAFTVGTADSSNIVGLSDSSTILGELLSGNNIVSTTAPSKVHDDSHHIASSQGLPHETYGPPKFRIV